MARTSKNKSPSFPKTALVAIENDGESDYLSAQKADKADMDQYEDGQWIGEYALRDIKRVKKTATLEKA